MTLEKLLGLSADEWEKLTDAELQKWAEQFYHVTKPTKEVTAAKKIEKKAAKKEDSAKKLIQDVLNYAGKLGIKIEKPPTQKIGFIYFFLLMISLLCILFPAWLLYLEWKGKPLPQFLKFPIN